MTPSDFLIDDASVEIAPMDAYHVGLLMTAAVTFCCFIISAIG